VYSVELDANCAAATATTLKTQRLDEWVTVICSDASAALDAFADRAHRFGLAFVDHAHDYDAVHTACAKLEHVLSPDGLALFHDFNDVRNAAPDDDDYGVYQAVTETLRPPRWRFCGTFGCCGLYQLAL
jgi:predicted O-methyltransferase YrrM